MNVAGLVALVAGVQAAFVASDVTASVHLGWRARWRQDNQGPGGANRVVFMPGRVPPDAQVPPKAVDAGLFSKPRQTSTNPRPLLWWHQTVTLSVWAYDVGAPEDESAQYAATLDLFEATVQAMHRAVYTDAAGVKHNVGLADIVWEAPQWVQPPVERSFGRELLAYFTHNGPIFDVTVPTATPKPVIQRGSVT